MEYDSEQIDPKTNGEGENKIETREAGGVWHYSITIRALLDLPTFQNRKTNFFQSHSGSQRKNHIIASPLRQPRSPSPFTCPAFQSPAVCLGRGRGGENTEHCGILRLNLCIFKAKIDPKRCIIFSTAFFLQSERERVKERKDNCVLCACVRVCVCHLYSDLYYVAVLYIVLSKHYMIMVKKKKEKENVNVISVKDDCFVSPPCSK